MKRREETSEQLLKQSLGRYRPSAEQVESARERCAQRFESQAGRPVQEEPKQSHPHRQRTRLPALLAAAAAIVAGVVVPILLHNRAPGILETASGSRNVQYGEIVRSTTKAGALLTLADGSRVEMRTQSQ